MRVDVYRTLRTLILGAWAAFFTWLIAGGAMYRYIGPRTYWVVWFGAIALTLAALSQALALRSTEPGALPSLRQLGGLAVMVLPLVVVSLIPAPSLGSLAARNRAVSGVVSGDLLQPPPRGSGEISLEDISYASRSADYAARLGISAGSRVKLTGFVTYREGSSEDTFALTRFAIFCCAADAIPYMIEVDAGMVEIATLSEDTWVEVTGTLTKPVEEYVVEATEIKKIDEPKDPYI